MRPKFAAGAHLAEGKIAHGTQSRVTFLILQGGTLMRLTPHEEGQNFDPTGTWIKKTSSTSRTSSTCRTSILQSIEVQKLKYVSEAIMNTGNETET